MNKKIKRIAVIAAAVLLAAGIITVYVLHRAQMNALRNDLTLEYEKERRMEERIEAIRQERDSLNGENQAQSNTIKDQSDKIDELEQKAKEMADKIDELLTEEVTVFDAGAVMEEIQNISELSTVEYRYTNVGTLDASKKFSFIDWKVPFSDKTVIVTMDGKIKAGTDLSQVKITGNEWKKEITVSMPKASILSQQIQSESCHAAYLGELHGSSRGLSPYTGIQGDVYAPQGNNRACLCRCQREAWYAIYSVPRLGSGHKMGQA